MALTQAELGRRIARARELSQMSQGQLAEAVGLGQSAISRIESGERGVDSLELARIAETLDVTPVELLRDRPGIEDLPLAARLAETTESVPVRRALARILDLVRLHHLLEEAGEPAEPRPAIAEVPPIKARSQVDEGRRLAEAVRKEWGLDDDPLPPNLYGLIERRADVVFAFEPVAGVAGLCALFDGSAIALIDSSVPWGRQRFSAAHELCHYLSNDGEVVIDETMFGRRTVPERRANAFAANFLMPPKSVKRYVDGRKVDAAVAAELQHTFGVSLEALLWQLLNLKLISDHGRRTLLDMGSKTLALRYGYEVEWRRLEEERGRRRAPRPLYERALRAYEHGLVGIEPVAELLGRKNAEALRRELDAQGIGHEERWWEATAPA
jgi:Zn-dependent peptidase ImmA (M78 family)/DNA-binding XRE family transcriptional regulator